MRSERSKAGIRGNHERWHVRRGIIDPGYPPFARKNRKAMYRSQLANHKKNRTAIANGSPTDLKAIINHRTKPDHTIPNLTVPRVRGGCACSTSLA